MMQRPRNRRPCRKNEIAETFDQETRRALASSAIEMVVIIFKDIDDVIQKYGQSKQLDVF